MKLAPAILSFIALAIAAGVAARVREVPWPFSGYLMAQALFTLLGCWGLQRVQNHDHSYAVFFAVGFLACLLLAIVSAGRFIGTFPLWLILVCVVAAAVYAVTWLLVVSAELAKRGPIQGYQEILLMQATVLAFCATLTLFSLAADQPPVIRLCAIALGFLWQALSAFFFAYLLGISRTFLSWNKLGHYMPQMLVIMAASWLTFQLYTMQRELATQEIRDMAVAHAEIAE